MTRTTITIKYPPRILAVAATGLAWLFAACSSPHDETNGPADANPPAARLDSGAPSGSSSGGGSGGGGSSGSPVPIATSATSACKAGVYQGTVTGSYFPDVDSGAPLSVAGNMELTLNQVGAPEQLCTIKIIGEGVTTEECSQVFSISSGTITGVMTEPGDGGATSLPYSCTVGGVLDCVKKILDDGWIQCSYCDGPAQDDAGSCEATAGGRFAGPLAANYDTTTLAFVDGMWNGAEVLAGNDGGVPGAEGGLAIDDLTLDGGYGAGNYGGSGAWSAACANCE